MLTFFKNFLGLKYEIESKPYMRAMNSFFSFTLFGRQNDITSILSYKHKERIIIEIETYWPGILIGKGGSYINEMKEYFKETFPDEKIELHLKECKIWMKLY